MPREGGRWCLWSQTHEQLPKHPRAEMGTGAAPLASLSSPESHPWKCQIIPPDPEAIPASGCALNQLQPLQTGDFTHPGGGFYWHDAHHPLSLLGWPCPCLCAIRGILFLEIRNPHPGSAGQKTADNSTQSFILCGIVTVRTRTRQ